MEGKVKMSIASELEALANNLQDINTAIVQKGGEASTTGASGMSSAIENIPSGGGEEVVVVESSYGVLRYYSEVTSNFTIGYYDSCDVTISDNATFQSFMATNFTGFDDVQCQYRMGEGVDEWRFSAFNMETMQEVTVDVATADMPTTAGLTVTPYENWATISISYITVVDTTSTVNAVVLSSQAEYEKLCWDDNRHKTIEGVDMIPERVEGFFFGDIPTSVPNHFLGRTPNLKHLSKMPSQYATIGDFFLYRSGYAGEGFNIVGDYVTTIGDFFLNGESLYNPIHFNSPIVLTRVTSVGQYFLCFNDTFNSEIDLGVLQSARTSFLNRLTAFDRDITIPSSLRTIATGPFMNGLENMTHTVTMENQVPSSTGTWWLTLYTTGKAYTQGIKLAGVHAQDWKNALPNSTTSPYRNLVLAS